MGKTKSNKTYFHFYNLAYSTGIDSFNDNSDEYSTLGPIFSTLEEAEAAKDTIQIILPDVKRINILYEVFETTIDEIDYPDGWDIVTCNIIKDYIKDGDEWTE